MTENPVILALDQSSTRTGCAKGRPGGPVALFSYSNPKCGNNYGRAMEAYRRWLTEAVADVDVVAFETPVNPSVLNLHTARLLYGIAGVIENVCFNRNLRVLETDNNQMKQLIYGKGGKKPEEHQAKRKARAWGFNPENIDECDAAGVFLTTVKHQFPETFDAVWAKQKALFP